MSTSIFLVQEVAQLQKQQAEQAALIGQLRYAEAAADRQCSKLTEVLQQQEQAHAELKAEVCGYAKHASGSAVCLSGSAFPNGVPPPGMAVGSTLLSHDVWLPQKQVMLVYGAGNKQCSCTGMCLPAMHG